MTRTMKIAMPLLIAGVLSLGACQKTQEQAQEEIATAQNPYPKDSPLHAPFERMLRKLASDPRYVALLKQSGPQAQQVGFQLAQHGVALLDRATLVQRLEILSQVIEKVEVPQCALLARGGNPGDAQALGAAMFGGLEKLPQAQIDRWFEISLKATEAALDTSQARVVSRQQIQEAMGSLLRSLPADQQQRLMQVLPQIAKASDADACWVARTLYRQALATPEPMRGQLAWVFAQQ